MQLMMDNNDRPRRSKVSLEEIEKAIDALGEIGKDLNPTADITFDRDFIYSDHE